MSDVLPSPPPHAPSATPDETLGRIADTLAQGFVDGSIPPVSEFVTRHPDLAEEILDLHAALVELPPPPGERLTASTELGGYPVLRELARGGMGVVFEALDPALGRRVALKVLELPGGDPKGLALRFHREARAAARLHHPHIVPVYDVGTDRGRHYYAMQYIEGRGLDAVIQGLDASALSAAEAWEAHLRRAARIGLEVAEALAHAHAHGVVHRDIKPSNILLDDQDHAWVTDFGLCKTEEGSDLTRTGDLVGTLRYLAPECLQGRAEVRSDIFSLGVTLFELLAQQHPLVGMNPDARSHPWARGMVPRVRRLEPRVPRDLDVIIRRATLPLPDQRYASAAELASDLRAFLEARPIAARRPSVRELLQMAIARNPILAATLAATTIVLLATTAVYVHGLNQAIDHRDRSLRHARAVTFVSASAEAAGQDPLLALLLAREAVDTEPTPRTLSQLHQVMAALHERQVLTGHEESVEQLYALGDATGFVSVDRHTLQAWTWGGVRIASFASTEEIVTVAVAPSGRRLAFATSAGNTFAWNLAQTPSPTLVGDAHVAAGDSDPERSPRILRFDTLGATLFEVECARCTIRDAASGAVRSQFPMGMSRLHDAALIDRDRLLIVAGAGGSLRCFEVETGKEQWERVTNFSGPPRLATAFGEPEFVAVGNRELLRFGADGESLGPQLALDDRVQSVSFTPRGEILATSSDQTARLFDRAGREIAVFRGHGGAVHHATITPDDQYVVTASADQSACLWRLDGTPVSFFRGHDASVNAALVAPDMTTVVTASTDTTVRLWDLQPAGLPVFRGHSLGLYSAAFSCDGDLVVTGGRDRTARVWSRDGRERLVLPHDELVYSASFLPTGARVFTTTSGPSAYVWSLDGTLHWTIASPEKRVLCGWFGGTAWRFVARGNDRSALVLDADARVLARLTGHDDLVWSAVFAPDGQRLATTSAKSIRVWTPQGALITQLDGHTGLPHSVRFDPSGSTLVSGSDDGTARVWRVADGACLAVLRGHEGAVLSAVFSPDGQRVLTASRDQTARIWSLDGTLVLTLNGHSGVVWSAEFSADGTRVATSSFDRTARLWWASPETLLDAVRGRLFRDFTPSERARYQDLLEPLPRSRF
ncbi:MAG: WD40 repeat domain-containing serine/threonine protein kinase [Planctomycetota bacterium]